MGRVIDEENRKAVEELQEAIKGMEEKLAALARMAEEATESIEAYIRRKYGDGQEDEPKKVKPTWIIDAWELMKYANNTKEKTVDANDIARFPRIDAVEVVRCKDCVYKPYVADVFHASYGDVPVLESNGECPCINEDDYFYSHMPDHDWFCANGERRAEE